MLVICSKIGQLGNRLTHMANIVSNAITYNYTVFYPYFDDYKEFFENFENNKVLLNGHLRIQLFSNNKLNKKVQSFFTFLCKVVFKFKVNCFFSLYRNYKENWTENFDMNDSNFIKDARSKITLLQGWLFRDYIHVKEHRDIICKLFVPKKWIADQVNDLISEAREEYEMLVGVHIRRGDYKDYNEGCYYYEDEFYALKIKEFLKLNQNKKIKFLICSNENINKNLFNDIDVCIDSRHFMVDLYALSQCDYILGPPSSFTNWASYYGNVPLLKLFNKEQHIDMNKFEIRVNC